MQAAEGWLDLGNHLEAHNELERLLYNQRTSPEVLKLHCRIYRKAEKWDYLSTLAKDLYAASGQEAFLLAGRERNTSRPQRVGCVILLHESRRFPAASAR